MHYRSRLIDTRGFSLVELLIALTLGVIVLGAAMGFLLREMRTLAGSEIRQSVSRNGRYIGVSLRHDIQKAGTDIESSVVFGTIKAWPGDHGDTLVVIYVPYRPQTAPLHSLVPPAGTDDPLMGDGTWGPRCLDLLRGPITPLEIAPGDLARLQVRATRRLILIEDLVDQSLPLGAIEHRIFGVAQMLDDQPDLATEHVAFQLSHAGQVKLVDQFAVNPLLQLLEAAFLRFTGAQGIGDGFHL